MLLWGCASKPVIQQLAQPQATTPIIPIMKSLDTSKIKNMADVRDLFEAFQIKMVVPNADDKVATARYDKVKQLLK